MRPPLFRAILLTIATVLAVFWLCTPSAFAANNDSPSISVEADNYCGGNRMQMDMSMGSCGASGGGCNIPGPSFDGNGPMVVPQAPAFDGSDVVPVPEPTNTASHAMNQLRATIGKPSLDDPEIMKSEEPSTASNQGYGLTPVTTLRPVTTLQPVTTLRPVTTLQPVTTWRSTFTPAPTAGFRYTERRLGLLGLRGVVVDYAQFGQPAVRTASDSPAAPANN